jgi:CheY-like chemotaxis protein
MIAVEHPYILVAEDDDEDRQLLSMAWMEANLPNQLVFVADGEELLDYLAKEKDAVRPSFCLPGLVLLDWFMPKVNGGEVLLHLQADPDLSQIPVVVLTNQVPPEARKQSLGCGKRVDWQEKSFTLDEWIQQLVHLWSTYLGPLTGGPIGRRLEPLAA